jgi:hypothetical protein
MDVKDTARHRVILAADEGRKRSGSNGDAKMSYSQGNDDRDSPTRLDTANVLKRGLMMLLVMVCLGVAQSVLYAIAVTQFLWMLIAGERNGFLAQFGHSLGLWLAESARFLSGDTQEKPFPWRPWPTS